MPENLTEIVGYLASIVGVSLMLPQVYKSWRTKDVEALSWGMLFLYSLNCFLWLIYGISLNALPVILTNAICLGISFLQIALKKHYTKTSF